MREILFRGKSKHGKWYYGFYTEGYYLDGTSVAWIEVVDRKKKETDSPTVIPETVGQFTGMTDKNGKKIFEGDICKVGNLVYKVVFEYSAWWFKILSKKVYCCPAFNSHCGDLCEVIGNIHDNPELLEDSQ